MCIHKADKRGEVNKTQTICVKNMHVCKIKDRIAIEHKTRVSIIVGFLFSVPINIVLGISVYRCAVCMERGVLI
jgi:hypothetical protein